MSPAGRALLAAACLLAGCATLEPGTEGESGRRALLEVPFYADKTDQCGPTALASLLSFWGGRVEPRQIRREIYLAHLKGSLPVDLYLVARSRGLSARMESGSLDHLKAELDAKRPAIAFLNLGYTFYPIGHFVVVTGYDDGRRGFFVHSDTRKNAFMSYRSFSRRWEKTGRWALLAEPPAA